jgi:hypothetical protein
MTDIMTSQNIDLSSRDILYNMDRRNWLILSNFIF